MPVPPADTVLARVIHVKGLRSFGDVHSIEIAPPSKGTGGQFGTSLKWTGTYLWDFTHEWVWDPNKDNLFLSMFASLLYQPGLTT
jgi:hypothetical protein